MSTIVLSGKHTDTAAFKKQLELPTTVRHIVNRDSLPPFARTLHVLPSFYDRRDVHAVEAQLRRLDRKVPGGLKRLEWAWDRENRVFIDAAEAELTPREVAEPNLPHPRTPEAEIDAVAAAVAAGVIPVDDTEEPWATREQVADETGAEGDDLLELLGELDS